MQSWLQAQTWLGRLQGMGDQTRDKIDQEMCKTSISEVFDLRDIL